MDENICQECGVSYDEDIIKMPGLGVTTRILVSVGFTIGVLALTENQAHVKSSFAVIAKDK